VAWASDAWLTNTVDTVVAHTLVAALSVMLHGYEIIWWRQARAEARALRLPA